MPRGERAPDGLPDALSAITRAVAESLELPQVFARVAEACRMVVPFDRIWISRLESGDRVRVFAVAGLEDPLAEASVGHEVPRSHYSPRVWPPAGAAPVCIDDAPRELDRSFPIDAAVMDGGMASVLVVSLEDSNGQIGFLWLEARAPRAFDATHTEALRPIADMVALALRHDRIWSEEKARRRRVDALEALLPTIAQALDVGAVFDQISEVLQAVIPHDTLVLGLLSEDGRSGRLRARVGGLSQDLPDYRFSENELQVTRWSYFLARDHTVLSPTTVRAHLIPFEPGQPKTLDMTMDPQWMAVYTVVGIRSSLRVTVRLRGTVVGAIVFSARQPDAYGREDVELGRRIADHIALALEHERLAEEVRRTAEAQERAARLETRVQVLADELEHCSPHRALGRSKRWHDVLTHATKVAPTETTVLITGESGTGKEVVARFIHRGSSRAEGPFVALNCAALPEQLLESELFGHEKGAFTGAVATRAGRIEQAAGGVLFLDEVGEMSPAVQAKFLRVLQEREFQRLGGARTLKADVRVLAATNRDLRKAIAQGSFREDLFYRLCVFEVPLPPLRERPEDVPLLAESFLEEIGRTIGRPAAGVSREARERLMAHSWPGNVRELRNAIERAMILCEGGLITSEHLPLGLAAPPAAAPAAAAGPVGTLPAEGLSLDAIERDLILQALARAGNNKSQAARLLGLTRSQLYTRLEKHQLADEA